LAQIPEQATFAHIADRTTPKQFDLALQILLGLCQRLKAQLDCSHYPVAQGLHSCVRDVYTDAGFRLKNLRIMQQQAAEPAKQQLITS
jgi:hypothetical protein